MVNTKSKRKLTKKAKSYDEIYYVLMFQIVLTIIIFTITLLSNYNQSAIILKEMNKLNEYINEEINIQNYKNITQGTENFFTGIKDKLNHLNFFDNLKENENIAAPVNGIITSKFGNRFNPITKKLEFHNGVDIAANDGDDIFAVISGEIIEINENDSYGKYIVVKSNDDVILKYCHCSEIISNMNSYVDSGEVIAKIGSTGNSTGPHLHLEIIKDDKNYNPLEVLGELYEI